MNPSRDIDKSERVQTLADHFTEVLSPVEPTVMKIQSLLVWEKPVKSLVMLVIIHGVFWYVDFTHDHYNTLHIVMVAVYMTDHFQSSAVVCILSLEKKQQPMTPLFHGITKLIS